MKKGMFVLIFLIFVGCSGDRNTPIEPSPIPTIVPTPLPINTRSVTFISVKPICGSRVDSKLDPVAIVRVHYVATENSALEIGFLNDRGDRIHPRTGIPFIQKSQGIIDIPIYFNGTKISFSSKNIRVELVSGWTGLVAVFESDIVECPFIFY